MTENAFSIFLYISKNHIHEIGYVCYPIIEDEESLCVKMRRNVTVDCAAARRFALKSKLPFDDYDASTRLATHLQWFEQIFELENAQPDPLVLITNIVDGIPKIDLLTDHSPFSYDSIQGTHLSGPGIMPDYLTKYMTSEGFDIPRLINDDYFLAMKLVFNAKHYISFAKLLLIYIDTVGFIEYGDTHAGQSFKQWLNTYAQLNIHGITADELWELRNGLLHMTNLDSKKVREGKHAPIRMYVGSQRPESEREAFDRYKYLNLENFLRTVTAATSKWIQSYNDDRNKMIDFIKRYDLTVSDSRVARVEFNAASPS